MITITLMGQLQTTDGERDLACELPTPVTVRQVIQRQGRGLRHMTAQVEAGSPRLFSIRHVLIGTPLPMAAAKTQRPVLSMTEHRPFSLIEERG